MIEPTDYEAKAFGAHYLFNILNYVADNFEPDTVYPFWQLKDWALANEYIWKGNSQTNLRGHLRAWWEVVTGRAVAE